MKLTNKLVKLGNEVGEEVWGYKRGSVLNLLYFSKMIKGTQK